MTGRVLVTGASGFIGRHLSTGLDSDGLRVRALVRRRPTNGALPPSVELCQGDLRDAASLSAAMEGVHTVYHLAAVYRKENVSKVERWESNVVGTRNLLGAARKAGVKRFVHCSSVGVLGDIHDPPADERTPYNPGDFYQITKAEAERTVLAENERGDLPCVVFRPAGAYGPGDSRFLRLFKALKRGYFIMLGKGDITYQMIFIDDLIEGIRLCGTRETAVGNIYILAAENPVRLNDLVMAAARAVGSKGPRLRLPVAPIYAASGVVEVICKVLGVEPPIYRRRIDFFRKNRAFSIQKAQRELGFRPTVSLKDGINRTVNWYESEGLM